MVYKHIDLFCGTGAFTLAFENNSFKTVLANDILPASQCIYDMNFKHTMILKDIHKLHINTIPTNVHVMTFGMNCQPYSIAGKQLGFNDKRSDVFWRILKILKKTRPKIFILENVKNIVSHDKGKTFDIILKHFKDLKYYIKYEILETSKTTGIPQHRERVYVIGFLDKKMYNDFSFPKQNKEIKSIKLYLEKNIDKKYFYSGRYKIYSILKENIKKEDIIYQYRRYYVRENKKGVCPTLCHNSGTGGHNVPLILDGKKIRKLTPRECFNLQGFPKSYILAKTLSDNKLYSLAGNAVSYPVVYKLAKKLKKILDKNEIQ